MLQPDISGYDRCMDSQYIEVSRTSIKIGVNQLFMGFPHREKGELVGLLYKEQMTNRKVKCSSYGGTEGKHDSWMSRLSEKW